MKSVVIGLLSVMSVQAFALEAGKPFQLPQGKYDFECWSTQTNTVDEKDVTSQTYEKGFETVVFKKGVAYDYTSSKVSSLNSDWFAMSETNTEVKTEALEDGTFKVTQKVTSSSYDSDGEAATEKNKFVSVIKVEGTTQKNLIVKTNKEAEKEGVGMNSWSVSEDGRIVFQSTIAKASGSLKALSSTCIYTPKSSK
jgi:hypothetical protein